MLGWLESPPSASAACGRGRSETDKESTFIKARGKTHVRQSFYGITVRDMREQEQEHF